MSAGFWLVLWCLLLLWAFCSRLRRGLRGEIGQLAAGWQDVPRPPLCSPASKPSAAAWNVFARNSKAMQHEVDALQRQVASGGVQ